MTHWRRIFGWIAAMVLTMAVVTSCDQRTVYHHFESTSQTGWEKIDTLLFVVPPLAEPGRYSQQIDVRINEFYPFTSLSLVVSQQVFPGDRRKKQIPKIHETGGKTVDKNINLRYDVSRIIIGSLRDKRAG